MKKILFAFLFIMLCFFIKAQIQIDSSLLDTVTISSGLSTVWDMAIDNEGKLWYNERTGRISRVDPETKENKFMAVLQDVYENASGGDETGLLGMALHPNFADSPFVYVVYNYLDGSSIKERLVRFTFSSDSLISQTTILENISGGGNHEGSRLLISEDRKIFMTTGDAGNPANSQNISLPVGKVLRLNLDGTVPSDNPISGSFVWAWGFRNSQGLAYGPNGLLYSSEHGPSNDDEINILYQGRNYGWPQVHGFCNLPTETQFCIDSNVVQPLISWTPTIAPADLEFYSNTAIPEFSNMFLLATLKEQELRTIQLDAEGDSIVLVKIYFDEVFGRIRAVCAATNGDIFIGTSNRDGRGQSPFPLAVDDRIIRLRKSNMAGINSPDKENNFMFFPNPAREQVFISGAGESFLLEIFSMDGRKIFSKHFTSFPEERTIHLPEEAAGIYNIVFTTNKERLTSKLVIIN